MTTDPMEDVHPAAGEAPPVPFDGLLTVLSYTVAPNAELYVSVMDAAVEARSRFHLHLRPSDVAVVVGVDHDIAAGALNYLADHRALHRTYDASEAETLSEFYKGAYLYQLTPAGTAAHRAVRDVLDTRLAVAGQLSASLLPRIHEALSGVEADAAASDDSRLKADFTALFALFAELSESAATYLRELDGEVAELASDSERLAIYKAAVLTYLQRFNRELSRWTPRIVEALERVSSQADDLMVCAARIDAAPRPDGTYDEGPIVQMRAQWEGTVAWFRSGPGRQATAGYVAAAMIAAINRVLGAFARLHERRLRRVSREADFMQLAAWFAPSTSNEAHELWDAATGLWGARHFHDLAGDEEVDRRKSFWDAGQAEVAPRVRAAVRRGSTGRPGKRADYSAAKRVARERAQTAAAQAAEARTRLAARTPARLSHLVELDADEFDAFLDILGSALSEHQSNGRRTAVLPGVTITLFPAGDQRTTTVRTPSGSFTGPDDELHIVMAAPGRRQATAS